MLHYKIFNTQGGVSIRRNVSKNTKWFYHKPKLENIIGGSTCSRISNYYMISIY